MQDDHGSHMSYKKFFAMIATSERAQIEDPRVRELADKIIESQRKEINEMEWLIKDVRANGIATTQEEAEARPVPDFSAAPE